MGWCVVVVRCSGLRVSKRGKDGGVLRGLPPKGASMEKGGHIVTERGGLWGKVGP